MIVALQLQFLAATVDSHDHSRLTRSHTITLAICKDIVTTSERSPWQE